MYSNIENVNILTSVLKSHGVRRVVVCPGSRNAPLVHNFNELAGITCYPVTDERSAGFMALGMAMKSVFSSCPDPVAVCVTSGSALLNVYPAIADDTPSDKRPSRLRPDARRAGMVLRAPGPRGHPRLCASQGRPRTYQYPDSRAPLRVYPEGAPPYPLGRLCKDWSLRRRIPLWRPARLPERPQADDRRRTRLSLDLALWHQEHQLVGSDAHRAHRSRHVEQGPRLARLLQQAVSRRCSPGWRKER